MTVREQALTTTEFEAFLIQAEAQNQRFELINGEIIAKPMPTREHGIIANHIGGEFYIYFRVNPIGHAAVEARHRPTGDTHNDRLPNVSMVIGDRPIETRGVADYLPDICIEIQSPDDTLKQMRATARFYIEHGAKFALVVLPTKRSIEVYAAEDDDQLLTGDDLVTFGDLLPGFAVAVGRLFPV